MEPRNIIGLIMISPNMTLILRITNNLNSHTMIQIIVQEAIWVGIIFIIKPETLKCRLSNKMMQLDNMFLKGVKMFNHINNIVHQIPVNPYNKDINPLELEKIIIINKI
jgi:hypothetical protein